MGSKFNEFNLDKFIATWIISGAIYNSPRAFMPLAFCSALSLGIREVLSNLAYWRYSRNKDDNSHNILIKDLKKAEKLSRYSNMLFSISVEYLRPPFQTALSNYVSAKNASIAGKVAALAFADISTSIHSELFPNNYLEKEQGNNQKHNVQESDAKDKTPKQAKGFKKQFPVVSGAINYFIYLCIREGIDQLCPRIYGYKPFGVIAASYLTYSIMAKPNKETGDIPSVLSHVCKNTFVFLYNQVQLKALIRVPYLNTEPLFRHMTNDFMKRLVTKEVTNKFF